jgi:hypothetical protein
MRHPSARMRLVYNAPLVSGSIDQDQVACGPRNRTLASRATYIDVTLIVRDVINLEWRDTVNQPSRIVDISSVLDNETVLDHPFMRPKIEYRSNFENAPMLLESFPGLRQEDLPDGEGWAFEIAQLTTHNGTHMDAPMHFHSKSIDGTRMMSIDEVPLEWFFRPAVKLDFRHCQLTG